MVTIDEAAALFTRRRAAWLREDLDGYLDCWADDMTFESPVHRPAIRGRDAYAALVRGSAAVVCPVRFDVLHLAVVGDAVLAEWEIEAEHRATGARLRWRGMSAAGYRDGRIAWWREYWNPADLAPRA